jgi:hypothetical protein
MNDCNFHRRESSRKTATLWPQFLIGAIGIGMVVAWVPAQASESKTLWECSSYTGDAHTRCLEGFAESQRDQIAALQGKLQAQQETVKLLKDQLDRQASASAELQRQLAQPPSVVQSVPSLYTYPPVGLGLYLGSPWIYGSPLFYRPYGFGPHYYGLGWGHRW